MLRKPQSHRPILEALETRTLLSAIARPDHTHVQHLLARNSVQRSIVMPGALAGEAKGFLKSAEATDSTTIYVRFRTPVPRRQASKLHFEVAGLQVTGAVLDRNGRGAVLKTTPQGDSDYTLKASFVRGTAGKVRATKQGLATLHGKSAPRVLDVTPLSDTSILVTFDRPMGTQAVNASNYALVGESAQSARITSAQFVGNSANLVALQTTPQSYGTYSFNVNNITDTSGQQVFFEGRKITGNPKGAVVSVAATSSTRVVVAFNEPMADNALAPQHYSIKDSSGQALLVTDARFDGPLGMVVVLTTAAQTSSTYRLTATNITDLQNDGLTTSTNSGSFQGIAAPALIKAVPTDPTRVVLTFSGPVGDSALAPSTYRIDKLDAQGNVVGSLPVIATAFVGNQRTVVEVLTPSQADARYRVTTTSALTDQSGSPLPAAQAEFQGISGQPKLVGATPNGPNTILMTFSEPMSDDALAPASYVIKDSSGATLQILSAQFIGTERRVVQLITGPQTAGGYTIQSITATDAGGDPVAAPGAAGGFQGVPSPSLSNATPTDPTHVILTFAGPVGDSALAPSSYKIDQLDAQGNIVGSLAVSAAAFVGDQRTIVSLTTPGQSDAPYRISTTSTLTDVTGLPLPIVHLGFQGLGSQPKLVGVTSTGPGTMLLTFSVPMSDDALAPSSYVIKDSTGAPLPVLNVRFVGTERRIVELTTGVQTNQTYTVVSIGATGAGGGTAIVPNSPTVNSFPGLGTPGESTPVEGAPRVVGAASLSNTEVIVSFSEPMAVNAIKPEYYFIVQQNVNPESGYLQITGATWYDANHTVVKLTTLPQNELTYQVTAVAMTDVAGNALASPILGLGGLVINPTSAQFPGSPPLDVIPGGTIDSNGDGKIVSDPDDPAYDPPVAATLVDTDTDGLPDNVEMRGWQVTVQLVDGTTATRTVTSDPRVADSDGDGLSDYQEANIRTDPRSRDTDDDQLGDFAEFNEIYSNPLSQDSDSDTLDDFLEFTFFKTSPNQADTDGDQLRDDYEILANRNPRVSDLPRPEITVGQVNLQLNVQFTETNDQQRRDLETKTVTSTLTKSENDTFTRSDTVNAEVHLEAGTKDGVNTRMSDPDRNTYVRGGFSVGYSFNQSSESATATEQAYESSLSTDKEVTRGSTVERVVQGAVMSVAIDLRNLSSLAYRVKNLQVTAFIQDPQDHSRLTPVATLLPDSEPDEGFTLGPLSPDKGPFKFSDSSIVPSLVESLMANSSGLIFRISNYDIIDENGRNFAFTSQEIVERTSRLVIDYGGASSLRALLAGEAFDELKPGDETEIYRVATSAGQVIDTNFDGTVDGSDRQAIFDSAGKEVGVTIFEALSAVGLKRYDEAATPTASLSNEQILSSYSTYLDDAGREKIYRIRGISNDAINKKYWEILTPLGIDQVTDLEDLILKTDSPVSLNFVQDLDKDGLSADVEFFLRTSDSPMPTGAEVPGTTDTTTDMSVTFNTDPGFVTGAIVRVTHDGGGLTAGVNYFVRNLGRGSYSFYDTAAHATAGPGLTGRIPLTDNVTAGIYTAARPISTNTTDMSVSYAATPTSTNFMTTESVTFGSDPGFPTATLVQVTQTGGGLTAGTNYFIRNLGGGGYSFYDSATNASAATSTAGRVNLSGNVTAGIFRGTDRSFPTATVVQVTQTGGGLTAGVNYFVRNLGGGSYSFYDSAANATAGIAVTAGRVTLSGNITAGIFSPTAKGRDTDGDGLDDRFEALIGWTVTTPQRTYQVYSSPNRGDSNFDAPKPGVDSDGDGIEDRLEYSGSDLFAAPAGWGDKDADGLRDRFEIFQLATQNDTPDYVLDPGRKDTDDDGINDGTEIIGFKITPITGATPFWITTNPTNPFTDSDTFSDGLERLLGLDPTNGADTDEDGDGLPDLVETLGWTVYTFGVSTVAYTQGAYVPGYDRHVTPSATDLVANTVRFSLANDPNIRFALVRVTGGGLGANTSYFLGRLAVQPDPNSVLYSLYLSAAAAAAGTSSGPLKLTSQVTDIQLAADYKHVAPSSTDLAADAVKFTLNSDPNVSPSTLVQVTGGGLAANTNYFLGRLAVQPDPNSVLYSLYLSAADATAGTASGALNLTSAITDIRLPADSRKSSRTDSVDSDGDGLTDYEEFFLGTDPSSADSDHDGIEDRVEFLGYALGHKVGGNDLGFIRTNPLDADTDDDKRSDGAEAELVDVELNRWVVRVRGETPYQVFSNPLVADADFDGLVDGDEFNLDPLFADRHTDPNNGNTDGDGRDDGVERGKTNPLAVDIRVTIVAESVEISTPGQYNFAITVKPPDSTGVAGLSTTSQTVFRSETATSNEVGKIRVHNTGAYVAKISFFYFVHISLPGGVGADIPFQTGEEGDLLAGQTATYDPGSMGVPLGAVYYVHMHAVAGGDNDATERFVYAGNDTVARYESGGTTFINRSFTFQGLESPVALPQDNVPLASRSYSFGLANDERFSIEGYITVITTTGSTTVNLGGLEGQKALQESTTDTPTSVRPVFSWIQVADKFIEDYYFEVVVNGVTVKIKFFFLIG